MQKKLLIKLFFIFFLFVSIILVSTILALFFATRYSEDGLIQISSNVIMMAGIEQSMNCKVYYQCEVSKPLGKYTIPIEYDINVRALYVNVKDFRIASDADFEMSINNDEEIDNVDYLESSRWQHYKYSNPILELFSEATSVIIRKDEYINNPSFLKSIPKLKNLTVFNIMDFNQLAKHIKNNAKSLDTLNVNIKDISRYPINERLLALPDNYKNIPIRGCFFTGDTVLAIEQMIKDREKTFTLSIYGEGVFITKSFVDYFCKSQLNIKLILIGVNFFFEPKKYLKNAQNKNHIILQGCMILSEGNQFGIKYFEQYEDFIKER